MRMCPACGAKDFDLNPPLPPSPTASPGNQSPLASTQPTTVNNSNAASALSSTSIAGSYTTLIPGSLGARTVAYFIDAVILAVLSAVPVTLAYLLSLPNRNSDFSLATALGVMAAYLIPFVYYTVLPASSYQATYGKRAMGLKIVTLQGERLSKAQAFIRILLMMLLPIAGLVAISLSFGGMAIGYKDDLAASIGIAWLLTIPVILFGPYLTVFFNPLKQTLYDMIVKTIVVKG